MTNLSSVSMSERYNAFSYARPVIVSLAFFLLVIALRTVELFVPGFDLLPDQNIFSRLFGCVLVLVFLRVLRKPIGSIGFHAANLNKAFLIGMASLVLLYSILYAYQFQLLRLAGETPRLVFGAIDPKTGTMGGSFFTLFYLFGQFVNAFMEEAIFRGIMLPHFMLRFRFWKANLLQAFLFGLAHLVFPIGGWVNGQATAGEAAAEAAVLLVFTTIAGLIFGYLYYRTDNLWTAVFAHFVDNVVGLFFHIQTAGRLRAEEDILMLASLGFIALVALAWIISKRYKLPTLERWGAKEGGA